MSSSSSSSSPNSPRPGSVGLVIIGDEILKGQTLDTNSHFIASRFHQIGLKVERISVIPDELSVISSEISSFSRSYSLVLTSGGIGPTHDDITYEGIAKAFDDRVELNQEIGGFVEKYFKTEDRSHPAFKLACIPSTARLNYGIDPETGERSRFPIVSVRNVYVFPGIPQLLKKGFNNLTEVWESFSAGRRFFTAQCFVDEHETSITNRLNEIVERHKSVSFGSYPKLLHNYYKVKLTLESDSEPLLRAAETDLRAAIPCLPDFDLSPEESTMDKIRELLKSESVSEEFKGLLQEAIGTVNECFDRYSDPNEISVCFNGGKDCIAVLHLFHAAFQERFPGRKLFNFYVKEPEPFPEVTEFLSDAEKRYMLDNLVLEGHMKAALGSMLQQRPTVKAAVLGLRKGDPGADKQGFFAPTDGDWPELMRVNPILHWDYNHVWTFLRSLHVPYPVLYDQGYTSLGCRSTTVKNPHLRYEDEATGTEKFRPAYELSDKGLERAGRVKKT